MSTTLEGQQGERLTAVESYAMTEEVERGRKLQQLCGRDRHQSKSPGVSNMPPSAQTPLQD
jgi:hypothetical protein